MTDENLYRKLITVARSEPVRDQVPFAFEKRVMALIRDRSRNNQEWWTRALWRAALACLAAMIAVAGLTILTPHARSSSVDLTQAFENTMVASVNQDADPDVAW